jgi:hypothetical protein
MTGLDRSDRADTGGWRSIGEVLAPIVKRLTVTGAIPKSAANRIVGSRWLRGA